MLEVRNVAFGYLKTPVLRDVNLVVSPGEVVSLTGANGCGKTTLMRLMATLLMPTAGQVVFDGKDAFQDPVRYRKQLGYLPEKVALYEDMTVKEYLTYRAKIKGEVAKRIRRRVGEASSLAKVEGMLRKPIKNLSYGQKKRVALADTILLRPRILLLDDFLSGLDLEMRESMSETLKEVAAFSSVLTTGHELEEMRKWSSRIVRLEGGRVL
ncbi:MAG: ABC transporter ATP-binding protein [Kiritimatiellae bacterium]|nr:ABC transporter ATP-binding protein [Kiritimatiellia bacterium]